MHFLIVSSAGNRITGPFESESRSFGSSITADDFENAAGGESGFVVADPLNSDITYGGSYMGLLGRLGS